MRAFLFAMLTAVLGLSAEAVAQPAEQRPLMHRMFQDHAVLQRGRPIAVWGQAEPGARVTVTLDGASRTVRADRSGVWRASLPARDAGGPYTLVAQTRNDRQTLSDIMVGDVYLCSGQSNMEFQTRYATNAPSVLSGAGNNQIRLLNVTRRIADAAQPTLDANDRWAVATPQSVADFSAVCYFFGSDIRRTQNVPIGLIASSWGGTVIEAWMSDGALRGLGGFDEQLALLEQNRSNPEGARAAFARIMEVWWSTNDPGGRGNWQAPDFDDSQWATIAPSGFWEAAGEEALANFDGIAWYRTSFTLTAAQAAQGGQLLLGPADDIDASYLNGAAIGATSGWDTPRTYTIAPGALREGRNVFASAVLDTGGGGGWWAAPEDRALVLADGSRVPLDQPWRYRISAPLSEVTSPPQQPWGGPNAYSALYNGMIAPLAPYGINGVLWYQGEANAGAASTYARLLPGMFADWRRAFAYRELPFFVVQLANYGPAVAGAPQRHTWGEIRDVQRRVTDADPRAALAVSVDIGDRYDIHPTQKLIVAERLALAARAMLYGEDVVASGPAPTSAHRVQAGVQVMFENTPLVVYSNHRPMAFELCRADRSCEFVDAALDGTAVLLEPRRIATNDIAFVRYCWGDSPVCNLYNDKDLPAVPFEIAVD